MEGYWLFAPALWGPAHSGAEWQSGQQGSLYSVLPMWQTGSLLASPHVPPQHYKQKENRGEREKVGKESDFSILLHIKKLKVMQVTSKRSIKMVHQDIKKKWANQTAKNEMKWEIKNLKKLTREDMAWCACSSFVTWLTIGYQVTWCNASTGVTVIM